jgi:AmmeMemoRadiSam system protein A
MRNVPQSDTHRPPSQTPRCPDVGPDVRRSLLDLARLALEVATGSVPISSLEQALDRARASVPSAAVFVTLTEAGELRGCIGSLEPNRCLAEAVVASAVSAALDDPRFPPVTAEELPLIHVDVSVLGPTAQLTDPGAFEPGLDGVVVERGGRRALLLPEVATEFGWGTAEMFAAVCRKAGLSAGAWGENGTRLQVFRTVRFGGPAFTRTN